MGVFPIHSVSSLHEALQLMFNAKGTQVNGADILEMHVIAS